MYKLNPIKNRIIKWMINKGDKTNGYDSQGPYTFFSGRLPYPMKQELMEYCLNHFKMSNNVWRYNCDEYELTVCDYRGIVYLTYETAQDADAHALNYQANIAPNKYVW